MSSEAKAAFLAERPRCEVCGTVAVEVDHDHATGLVRGALCRRCNGRIGSLEAALRLPSGPFQAKARDLHRALERDGRLDLREYHRDLMYLGISEAAFLDRLRAVQEQLVVPYVYWTEVTSRAPGRRSPWAKIGPLTDLAEAERHRSWLLEQTRVPPHLWVVVAREPDDGVNSPWPRGLFTQSHTPGAAEAFRNLMAAGPPDLSAHEAAARDFADLAVPVLLSRPLTADEIRAAHWNPDLDLPCTQQELRELIGGYYSASWLDLAVRIALDDLGGDLPDRRWASFGRARWHWRELCAYWRDRQGPTR
ncbi:endonuclease domain-containing protein [Kitasatospora sp. NPDC056531]|uniref:endonuclease domain-containing protein n=1 Tax=Kitasatospora sp. NPDC056531 TaxID=3345856 RepID=UPI0036854437